MKVYRPSFEALAQAEYERTAALFVAGVPCPRVHEIVEVEGRVALVFERLEGPSLLEDLVSRTRTAEEVGRMLAELHEHIQRATVSGLPDLVDTMAARGVGSLPRGRSVLHGDFHPGNVMHRGDELVVIDWSNAHLAPPAADVACALLAMRYRGLRAGDADVERRHRARVRLSVAYESATRAARPEVMREVPEWYRAIGTLLLEQEPATAYADELEATITGRAY